MHSSGLPLCSKAASLSGTLSSQQGVSLTPSGEAAQHGAAQHSMQPGHMHDAAFAGSQALQPDCKVPAEAGSQCEHSCGTSNCTIVSMKIPSSGNAAAPCKVGSELSGRRAKQKKSDLCSIDVEEQAGGAAHAAQSRAHLEWAQRTGYCAVLTLGVIAGAFIFASACAYHWSVLHESPLALPAAPLGEARGDELLSWEELALRHGNEAVIILSDSNHREPVLTARSNTGPPAGTGGTLNAILAAPPGAGTAPAAAARSGFLGHMSQHRSKHAKGRNSMEGDP